MKPPIWLYGNRDLGGIRIRRWGSARPLGVVFTRMEDNYTTTTWMCQIWRWNSAYGPVGSVYAGHTSLPHGSRTRVWHLPNGMGFGLGLRPAATEPRRAA